MYTSFLLKSDKLFCKLIPFITAYEAFWPIFNYCPSGLKIVWRCICTLHITNRNYMRWKLYKEIIWGGQRQQSIWWCFFLVFSEGQNHANLQKQAGEMGPMLTQLSRRAVAVDANSRCLYFVDTSSGKHFASVAFWGH